MFDNKIVLDDTLIGMPGINYFLAILDASNTTTIDELKNEKINPDVYPNPTSGIFIINFKNKSSTTTICVYDVLGNCILNKYKCTELSSEIDLSTQAKGIYFIEIISAEERVVKKVALN